MIAFSSTSIVVTLLWAMAKRKQENMDVDIEGAARADNLLSWFGDVSIASAICQKHPGQAGGKAMSGSTGVVGAGMNITAGVPCSTIYPKHMMQRCSSNSVEKNMVTCSSNSVEKSMVVIASTAVTLIYIHTSV